MPVSKVIYGNNTLVDLTSDTVTADKLVKGVTAHSADGTLITGTLDILEQLYPIGTIYTSTKSDNPSSSLGGTWTFFARDVTFVTDDNGTEKQLITYLWERTA